MVQAHNKRHAMNQALLRPTYQNRLRVIGHHLDRGQYRDVAILEIDGGFIARATGPENRRPQALEFPDSQFVELMQEALNDRGRGQKYNPHAKLLPTGYEDFFRSLGFLLDNQSAVGITVCELDSHLLVAGQQPSDSIAGHKSLRGFERYLTAADIQKLLDDAFNRRTDKHKRGGFLGIF